MYRLHLGYVLVTASVIERGGGVGEGTVVDSLSPSLHVNHSVTQCAHKFASAYQFGKASLRPPTPSLVLSLLTSMVPLYLLHDNFSHCNKILAFAFLKGSSKPEVASTYKQ